MVICYRKKMLRLAQIWFYGSREEFRRSGKEEAAMAKKADIAFYHGIREPESGPFCLKQTFHSRFSDLTLPEETLFLQISKTGRNEVRRSEKDGAEREFFDSGELLERPEILEGLAEMYRRMYASKGKEAFMNLPGRGRCIVPGSERMGKIWCIIPIWRMKPAPGCFIRFPTSGKVRTAPSSPGPTGDCTGRI